MNISIRGSKRNEYHTVNLNGDVMTGDTFPVKGFIKDQLRGKWNGERKAWIVNTDEVKYWLGKGAISEVEISETTNNTRAYNGLCPHCHTYCYGDCQSH